MAEQERSVSREAEESDIESRADSVAPGKPGRKKNPNSQAARRDQNRIAQREFRLRKQQRIRDLEARVEILSGGKDEALGEMRNMLKGSSAQLMLVYQQAPDLMAENNTLRGLLRGVAGFIGDGAGGLLPKLGWDMSDFESFVNRSETDTAWEGYQRRKKLAAEQGGSTSQTAQKHSLDDDSILPQAKKSRSIDADNQYAMLLPMSQSTIAGNTAAMYPSARTDGNGIFSDMMKNSPTMFSPPTGNTPPQYTAPPASAPYGSSYIPSVNLGIEMPFPPNNPAQQQQQQQQQQKQSQMSADQIIEDDDDPNKNEAYKLIHYHLDNFKRNSAYCLPSSLRPTLVQKTVPHEGVIDRILHPELRDRMILLRGRFDLVDCLLEYRNSVTIHGDDVLAHVNWEIGEQWLRRYGFLVDPATLAIMNRWRRERGEPELRLSDISTETPGST